MIHLLAGNDFEEPQFRVKSRKARVCLKKWFETYARKIVSGSRPQGQSRMKQTSEKDR